MVTKSSRTREYARGRILHMRIGQNAAEKNLVTYAAIAVYAENQSTRASPYDHLQTTTAGCLKSGKNKIYYYDIENATKDLFSTGGSTAAQSNAALSDLVSHLVRSHFIQT